MTLRPAPAALAQLLDTSHAVHTRVDVWRGSQVLGQDLPLTGGELAETSDTQVPETVRFEVPAVDRSTGRTWVPRAATDALAPNGQRARLTYVVTRGEGDAQLAVPLGWFQLTGWTSDGRTVSAEASGLLNVVREYRLLAPTSPPAGATFASEVRRLLEGRLPVAFAAGLVDRAIPASMAWQDDRLGALWELADAWPASMTVDPSGVLRFDTPPDADPAAPAQVTLQEWGGTVLSDQEAGSRDGTANVVVARGEDSTDPARPPIVAVARDEDPASPTYVAAFGDVVEFFASPLLTTTAAALAAAQRILTRKRLQARSVPLAVLPDPRVRPWTRVDYVRKDATVFRGIVTATRLPLTADGGAASVQVGEL